MLFSSFFWAFFHSSLAPTIELGVMWPPEGINPVNTWALPLLGSTVLVASGFVLTIGHHALIYGNKILSLWMTGITVILGALFLFLQANEYYYGEVTISDSVYGSVFYMTTGLHALHVIIGVLFLFISYLRILFDHFTTEHHVGFEFAIYYWHLVDVVWLFVFLSYYWWTS
jgi:cytochrome c oxidase subunit 3